MTRTELLKCATDELQMGLDNDKVAETFPKNSKNYQTYKKFAQDHYNSAIVLGIAIGSLSKD